MRLRSHGTSVRQRGHGPSRLGDAAAIEGEAERHGHGPSGLGDAAQPTSVRAVSPTEPVCMHSLRRAARSGDTAATEGGAERRGPAPICWGRDTAATERECRAAQTSVRAVSPTEPVRIHGLTLSQSGAVQPQSAGAETRPQQKGNAERDFAYQKTRALRGGHHGERAYLQLQARAAPAYL
jgi:hypothetical protein